MTFLRNLASLLFLVVVGGGGWYGYQVLNRHELELRDRDERIQQQAVEIQELEQDVALKAAEIERLDLALKLLKVDRRRAQIVVLDQQGSAEEGDLSTRVKFVEVDEEGEPVGEPREIEIEGDLLYVDAWVVKFDDELVEQQDPTRSASICLFRRVFGEEQKPSEGQVLDTPLARPVVYGGDGAMSELEKEIWKEFWDIANDPARSDELGVRAAHGEAPSMKLRKGKVYNVTLRASGGLSIEAERLPAVVQE
jgi:hypothetical protein